MATREKRIVINEETFKKLIRGDVAELSDGHGDKVKIILSDIGWHRMTALIIEAAEESTSI